MKTLKIFSILPLFIAISLVSFAQKKTETIPVSGNCGMCEAKIEKAAKEAGASAAEWNKDTKVLTVSYNSSATNAAKIQQAIAKVGYDTRDFKATEESYNKLHACCQYERETVKEAKHDCSDKCDMKDGKCTDMQACKDKGCCKESGSGKTMSCCSKEGEGEHGKMDCCKNGKCEKHS
ncbi:MAG: cation transporter [Chitinophagaceae bacterium]|nr:cation transporter [Chitinophagaceae bacterium]